MPSFKRRLDVLADTMAAHGLGQSYCGCPNSDVVGAKQFIMQKLLPEVEYADELLECNDHRPRPSSVRPRKKRNLGLKRFFPDGLSELGEMTGEWANFSFAEAFLLLPLEARLERFFVPNKAGDGKDPKPRKSPPAREKLIRQRTNSKMR